MRKWLRRVKTAFINIPMAGKLSLLLLMAGIIPILLISFYSYRQTYNDLLEKTRESMAHTSHQVSTQIDSRLSAYQQISSILYTDNILKSYLTKIYTEDYDFVLAYEYINNLMYGLIASNEGLAGITLYTGNPTLPSDGLFVKKLAAAEEDAKWLMDDQNSYGNIVFSGPRRNKDGALVWSLGRKMNFNNYNYTYAYLVIDVLESALYRQIEYENSQSQMYVAAADGTILSASDKTLISTNLSALLNGSEAGAQTDGQTVVRLNGEDHLVVASPLQNGWHTVMVFSLGGILAEVRAASARIAGIAGVCLLLSLTLVFAISRYFSGRLKALNSQVFRIQTNDLEHLATMTGNDELANLSRVMNTMAYKLDEAIRTAREEEIERRHAQLSLLQSQINPHFLYNTLSGISALALRAGDEKVSQYLNHLSQFYKISLNQGRDMITIGEEIRISQHYIALQNMRFQDRLMIRWDIDESLEQQTVPKLILQPFIENIVDHALTPRKKAILVSIRLFQDAGMIVFEIMDKGSGIPPETLATLLDKKNAPGYGIVNVYHRLQLLYKDSCTLTISSEIGKGTLVRIAIPHG